MPIGARIDGAALQMPHAEVTSLALGKSDAGADRDV